MLATDPQPLARGHHTLDAGRRGEHVTYGRRTLHQVLEVVEQQEQLPARQVRRQLTGLRLLGPGQRDPKRRRHCGRNLRRLAHTRQLDEPRTVLERRDDRHAQVLDEPRLAHAARPGHREQPGRWLSELGHQLAQLPVAAHELVHLGAQVRGHEAQVAHRGVRRRARTGGRDQIHAHRPRNAPQVALTQVEERKLVGCLVIRQVDGDLGCQHLAATRRLEEPRRDVRRRADIVSVDHLDLTGVDRHANRWSTDALRPLLRRQRRLQSHRAPQCIRCAAESAHEAVSLEPHFKAFVLPDHAAHHGVVQRQSPSEAPAPGFPPGHRPLDIREHQCHRAGQ